MRHLFWPTTTVTAILTVALIASMYRVTYTTPSQNTFIELQSWSITVWNGAFENEPDHGLFTYYPKGLDAAFVSSSPKWAPSRIWNERILMPGAKTATHAPATVRKIGVPVLYLLAAWCAVAFLPTRAWVIHRRRIKQGGCPACGYDLTGIDEAAPCPECGKER